MSEIVELVRGVAASISRYYYLLALALLGVYMLDRGRRAADQERAEEARERHAA